jgi:hypothetical protein
VTCEVCGAACHPRAKTCPGACRRERERRRSAARYPRERTVRLQRQQERNRVAVPDPGVLLARIVAELVEEPPLREQFPEMPVWEDRTSLEGYCQDLDAWAKRRLGR